MALIPSHTIAEIRDRTDLVAVVGEHVQLRRAGTNYVGLCPFHQEKSPSFSVSPQKGFFYCFGCHKSGDAIRFVTEVTGRSFVEVATELAQKAGVVIPEPTDDKRGPRHPEAASQAATERARLLRINEFATKFFEAELTKSSRAKAYLAERGIHPDLVARFRLGYAPDAWDGLLQKLLQRAVPQGLAEQAGLLIRREHVATKTNPQVPATGATHYDRFRDRILFPLLAPAGSAGKSDQTVLGDVIAFGGRVLPGTAAPSEKVGAKYINSPETPLYRKGDHLYGLHAARDAIRKRKQAVLVEGNFDVIMLHQAGWDNTVAPMGTALTESQARLLGRLVGEEGHVVLLLDGDRAGRAATLKDVFLFAETSLRDLATLQGRQIDVRIASLPDGEDPDTLARKKPDELARILRVARSAMDHVLDEFLAQTDAASTTGRAKTLERLLPLLRSVRNSTAQALQVDRVASALGLPSELIYRQLALPESADLSGPAPRAPIAPASSHAGTRAPSPPPSPLPPVQSGLVRPAHKPLATAEPLERLLLALLADHPVLWPTLSDQVLDSIESPLLSELIQQAHGESNAGTPMTVHRLLELAPAEAQAQVAEIILAGRFSQTDSPHKELEQIGRQLRARAIQREVKDLTHRLVHVQRSGDPENTQAIYRRIQQLNQLRADVTGAHMQRRDTGTSP